MGAPTRIRIVVVVLAGVIEISAPRLLVTAGPHAIAIPDPDVAVEDHRRTVHVTWLGGRQWNDLRERRFHRIARIRELTESWVFRRPHIHGGLARFRFRLWLLRFRPYGFGLCRFGFSPLGLGLGFGRCRLWLWFGLSLWLHWFRFGFRLLGFGLVPAPILARALRPCYPSAAELFPCGQRCRECARRR